MGQIESLPLRKTLEKEKDRFDLHVLNVQNITIEEKDAERLANLFKQQTPTKLQMIQLGACNLTPNSLSHLAEGITDTIVFDIITRIDLSTAGNPPEGNPIGKDGATSIALLIKKCSNLHHFKAADCQLDCDGMIPISESLLVTESLKTLDLSYNLISDEGADKLGSALSKNGSLHGLSLWKNLITGKGIENLASGLRSNCTLEWLGLGCNAIGDQGVQALTEALTDNIVDCKITWLALGNNQISDKGAEMLAEFLSAGWTSIDEDEGEEGVACPLTSLGLGGNEITSKGAKELAQSLDVNNKLKSLGLSFNKICNEGAISLAEMLRNNTTLENLSLSGNTINSQGGEILIASLCQNNSLSTLLLSQNPLDDSVCTRCIEVFTRYNVTLQVLDLNETNISSSALQMFIAQLKGTQSKIRLPMFGDQLLTISEKDRTSKRISGNLLEVASWRPPPSSMVPSRGVFDISDRTHSLLHLSAIPVPSAQADDNSDVELSRVSSSSSIELDILMFSGKLVTNGEGEIAKLNNSNESLIRSNVGSNKVSSWRKSKLVQESLELEPKDFSTCFDEDEEYEDSPKLNKVTMIDEVEAIDSDDETNDHTVNDDEIQPSLVSHQVEEKVNDENVNNTLTQQKQKNAVSISNNCETKTNNEQYIYDTPRSVKQYSHSINEPIYDEIPKDYIGKLLDVDEKKVFYKQSASRGLNENYDLFDVESIDRQPLLYSVTKERPKPPQNRRHPSINLIGVKKEKNEEDPFYVNIGFIHRVDQASDSDDEQLSQTNVESKDTRPIKEQWATGLKQRTAMLRMGGFIHKGYDTITQFMETIEYNNFMAQLACNGNKNRVNGPLAPSHTRVKLQRVMEDLGSDYINANFIGSPSYPKSYIIAQWPTEVALPTFWRMIWELNVGVIIVIGNCKGEDKFWPEKDEYQLHSAVIMGEWYDDSIFVRTDKVTPTSIEGLTETTMVVHSYDDDITEKLTLFHYSQWPQNGVPQSAYHIAYLFHRSLKARIVARTVGPLVVVSAHGGGRAGCYCAVSVAYELMQVSGEPNPFDDDPNIIGSVFKGLLSQRPGLVATQRQYDFCHRVLEECLWGKAAQEEDETDGKGKGGKFLNKFKKKKKSISS